jgi:hypothetical protein
MSRKKSINIMTAIRTTAVKIKASEEKAQKGIYCYYTLSPKTIDNIKEWTHAQRIPGSMLIDPSEYHVTTVFSKEPFEFPGALDKYPVTADFKGFDLLGNPDKDTLVILLHSPFLSSLAKWRKELGMQSDFADYKPHISIAKDDDLGINTGKLSPIKFPIILSKEHMEPLVENYEPKKSGGK